MIVSQKLIPTLLVKIKNCHNLSLDQAKDDEHIPTCGIIKGDKFLARNIETHLSTKSNNTNIIADSILSPHPLSNIAIKKEEGEGEDELEKENESLTKTHYFIKNSNTSTIADGTFPSHYLSDDLIKKEEGEDDNFSDGQPLINEKIIRQVNNFKDGKTNDKDNQLLTEKPKIKQETIISDGYHTNYTEKEEIVFVNELIREKDGHHIAENNTINAINKISQGNKVPESLIKKEKDSWIKERDFGVLNSYENKANLVPIDKLSKNSVRYRVDDEIAIKENKFSSREMDFATDNELHRDEHLPIISHNAETSETHSNTLVTANDNKQANLSSEIMIKEKENPTVTEMNDHIVKELHPVPLD